MTNFTRKGFLKSLALLAVPAVAKAQSVPTFTFSPGWNGTAKVTPVSNTRARLQISAIGTGGTTLGRSFLKPANFYFAFNGVGGMFPHTAFIDGNGDVRFYGLPPYGQFFCDVEFDTL
jgi:hypothetical protein